MAEFGWREVALEEVPFHIAQILCSVRSHSGLVTETRSLRGGLLSGGAEVIIWIWSERCLLIGGCLVRGHRSLVKVIIFIKSILVHGLHGSSRASQTRALPIRPVEELLPLWTWRVVGIIFLLRFSSWGLGRLILEELLEVFFPLGD